MLHVVSAVIAYFNDHVNRISGLCVFRYNEACLVRGSAFYLDFSVKRSGISVCLIVLPPLIIQTVPVGISCLGIHHYCFARYCTYIQSCSYFCGRSVVSLFIAVCYTPVCSCAKVILDIIEPSGQRVGRIFSAFSAICVRTVVVYDVAEGSVCVNAESSAPAAIGWIFKTSESGI